MRIVVIAPYGGNPENLARIGQHCKELLLLGHAPFNSALFAAACGLADDCADHRRAGTRWGLDEIRYYNLAHVIGDLTPGMQLELEQCQRWGLQVYRLADWSDARDWIERERRRLEDYGELL